MSKLPPVMAQTPSTAAVRVAPPLGPTSPPISSLLPLVTSAFFSGLSALSVVVWLLNNVLLSLLSPFLVIVTIPIYLLAPAIISSKILIDLLVVFPYRAASYVAQAVYPVYAFVGVACISGALVGFGARQLVGVVGWGLLGDTPGVGRSRSPSGVRPQKRPSASARGKRRVTVKTED